MKKIFAKLSLTALSILSILGLNIGPSNASIENEVYIQKISETTPLYLETAKSLEAGQDSLLAGHWSHSSHRSHYSHSSHQSHHSHYSHYSGY